MPLKLNELNSPPIVAVNCDNQNVMRKEKNGTQRGLENQKQMIILSLGQKHSDKMEIKFEINKDLEHD